jgi:hypothetical protein
LALLRRQNIQSVGAIGGARRSRDISGVPVSFNVLARLTTPGTNCCWSGVLEGSGTGSANGPCCEDGINAASSETEQPPRSPQPRTQTSRIPILGTCMIL